MGTIIITFYKLENWDTEQLSHLYKVSQVISGGAEIWT